METVFDKDTALIKAVNINKSFKTNGEMRKIISNFNHTFESGKFYLLKGSSGNGKTTLLSLLSLLQEIDSGEIYYDGKRVDNLSSSKKTSIIKNMVGIVFQDSNLLSGLNVYDNITIVPITQRTIDKTIVKSKALEILRMLQLEDKETSSVTTLSGGEKQRVGIARAIINSPKILICDEPIASLDDNNASIIVDFLIDYCKKYNKIVIVSSHSNHFDLIADEILHF